MKKLPLIIFILSLLCLLALSSCDDNSVAPDNDQQTTAPSVVCQHTFGNWNTVKQPTCKEEGTQSRTCSKCAQTEEDVIPMSDTHSPVTDAAVSASCKDTGLSEGSHCSVCNKVLVAQVTVAKLNHTYDQKKTTAEYIKTSATTSAAATYYYSCKCGLKGTTYFSYGSPLSGDAAWTSCNKTVYGIALTKFYTKPSSTGVCGTSKVGYSIQVVSTNGEWYKVSENNPYTNCVAYIKCSDVTDNSSIATSLVLQYSVNKS